MNGKKTHTHAFIMNNFRHRVLRIEPNNAAVQKGASRRPLVGALNLHLDKKIIGENWGEM